MHSELGPGLFKSVYEEVLSYEIVKRGFTVARQVIIPVHYDGMTMELGFRTDLVVNEEVIVEIKAVEKIVPVHKKQVITYLKLSGLAVGLLINLNEELLKEGLTRLVNNYVQ